MKRAVALLWPLLPCVALSALIHSTDDDVAGLAAVASSPGLLASVVIWSLPLAVCAYLALAAYLEGGAVAFLAVAGPLSGLLGFLLARAGSTVASAAGFAWSVAGATLLLLLALSLAVLPGGVVVRRSRAEELSVV